MADGDLKYSGPTDSADALAGPGPGAPPASQNDPSQVTGQDPTSFLGIKFSYSTGAGGSPPPGGEAQGAHPTTEPNQYPAKEPLSGVSLDGTGAQGTQGAPPTVIETGGPGAVVTDPNYTAGKPGGGSGTQFVTVPTQVGGPQDSTMVVGQYPPAQGLPKGDFYPVGTDAGKGKVLVGGFLKGDRGGGDGQRPAADY